MDEDKEREENKDWVPDIWLKAPESMIQELWETLEALSEVEGTAWSEEAVCWISHSRSGLDKVMLLSAEPAEGVLAVVESDVYESGVFVTLAVLFRM